MRLVSGQKGQTLLEVLIAIAILGMIAVPFLTALSTSSRALIIADERTTAESLVRSEIEYVKSCQYDNETAAGPSASYEHADVPSLDYPGYTVSVDVEALNDPDAGIQNITVTVKRDGEEVLTTSTYKSEHL